MPEKIYLLIPYEKKDELKQLHKIRWDAKLKLWFVDEMVEALKPYTKVQIEVDYDDKDYYKGLLKSMKWDAIGKTWSCSLKDSKIFYEEK
jgi:hypothetical protein